MTVVIEEGYGENVGEGARKVIKNLNFKGAFVGFW